MPTKKIVVEAATLADAVQKASRVAPTKGSAFDRFAGIYIEVTDEMMSSHPVVVRATNGDVTYQQRVGALEYDGPAQWRIPAPIIAGFLTSIPLDGGRTITFIDKEEDKSIRIVAGKVKAKFNMIVGEWPIFPDLEDPATFASASDFSQKADQVVWATHASTTPLSGVHLTGEKLLACDKFKMARIPCVVPLDKPTTVPLRELSRLLANGTDVKLRAIGSKLYIMLDPETQATTTIYTENYPDVEVLVRNNYSGKISFSRQELLDAIGTQLVLVKGDRYPKLNLKMLSDGDAGVSLTLDMDVPDVGRLQDSIDCKGTVDTGDFEMFIHPVWLQDGLNGTKADRVEMQFGPTALDSVYITDDKGYETVVSAIRKDNPAPKTDA